MKSPSQPTEHLPDFLDYERRHAYSTTLQTVLLMKGGLEPLADIQDLFDAFLEENQLNLRHATELETLDAIKRFLYEKSAEREAACADNPYLSDSDCLTMAVITCLLSKEHDWPVTIGCPQPIERRLHAVILKADKGIFKVTGTRTDYATRELPIPEVMDRLRYIKPFVRLANAVRRRVGAKAVPKP